MPQEHWSTILANIVTSVGVLSFIGIYYAYRQSQNQFKFTVMLSCIERFQQLTPFLKREGDDLSHLKKYVDLTNEEFFYFQQEYIPKEVIVEWMDSIVDIFPVYLSGTELPINYDKIQFRQIHDEKLLKEYPRLLKALTISDQNDFTNKVSLIRVVAKNLGITLRDAHFKKAHVF